MGKLADGDGSVINQANEAEVSEDFLVIPDQKVGDDCSNHSGNQQTSRIKKERKGSDWEDEVKNNAHPADYFNQGDRANDAGIEIGDPTHPTGEHIDGLEEANATTKGKDKKKNNLCGWLKVGHYEKIRVKPLRKAVEWKDRR